MLRSGCGLAIKGFFYQGPQHSQPRCLDAAYPVFDDRADVSARQTPLLLPGQVASFLVADLCLGKSNLLCAG